MSSFALKIIAMITMLCDHCGYIFLNKTSFLNVIGKISFPIFAFQISEGYKHTKNLKLYIFRLFLFAIASQIPFSLFLMCLGESGLTLNIFFTLLLGLLSILIYDKSKNKFLGIFPVILLIALAEFFHCDYGWFGVTIIFLFYLFKNNRLLMNSTFIFAVVLKYLVAYYKTPFVFYLYFVISNLISLLIINLYNGKKGRNIKYLLYIFYPLHLMIIYIIHVLMFGC